MDRGFMADLSASACADGAGRIGDCPTAPTMGLLMALDELDLGGGAGMESSNLGVFEPSSDALRLISGLRGAGDAPVNCRSVISRLKTACFCLRPLRRLKMMARTSGRKTLRDSWVGSSASACSRHIRRSVDVESNSLLRSTSAANEQWVRTWWRSPRHGKL